MGGFSDKIFCLISGHRGKEIEELDRHTRRPMIRHKALKEGLVCIF